MTSTNELSGVAAPSICESLLLAMNDHKLLPESEIVGVLRRRGNARKRGQR